MADRPGEAVIEAIRAELSDVLLRHMHARPDETLSAVLQTVVGLVASIRGDRLRATVVREIVTRFPEAVEQARAIAVARTGPHGHA